MCSLFQIIIHTFKNLLFQNMQLWKKHMAIDQLCLITTKQIFICIVITGMVYQYMYKSNMFAKWNNFYLSFAHK